MTREEAITVLEGLSDNPLFSNQHKAAFNIAIHDIKQRHDWDINNLILINKDNYESLEQEPILDKVKQAIKEIKNEVKFWSDSSKYNEESLAYVRQAKARSYKHCLEILDKIESEG